MPNPYETMMTALNRLSKWRFIFASWQLGTRSATDPVAQAVRDHREVTLILRAEVSALVNMLVKQYAINRNDYMLEVAKEAELLSKQLEERFPGAKPSDIGMEMETERVIPWMSKFPP